MAWPVMRGRMRLMLLGGIVAASLVAAQPVAAGVFYPETYVLSNGMQVVIVPNRLSSAVAQMVWYKVGAADDPVGHSGIAHYLEHMMFKGTDTLETGQFTSLIAAQGGQVNAYTTHDTTAYHEIVAADRLGMVMQMEADRMRHLRLLPDEAASELSVVLSERQERTDNKPQGAFFEKMAAALYGDHPYGRPVIGWKNEIAKITPDEARAFYKKHYAPNNAVLVISGNVKSSEVLRLAAATFGKLEAEGAASPRKPVALPYAPDSFKPSFVTMRDPRVTQPVWIKHAALPAVDPLARRSYALDVLAEVLSSGEVGLLQRHFEIEKEQASAIDASYDSMGRGPVSFSLSATPSPSGDVRVLARDVEAYLRRLAQAGIPDNEIRAAKQRMQDAAIFARDRLMAPAEVLGQAVATGQGIASVEAWPDRIRAVTKAEVDAALRQLVSARVTVQGVLEPEPKAKEAAP